MKLKTLFGGILMAAALLTGCASAPASSTASVSTTDVASSVASSTISTSAAPSATSETTDSSDTLIVYYSYTGTTRRVAEHLQNLTGGTLYELTLTEPYTGSSNDVSDRVFAERDNGMPELAGELPDLSQYSRILIGTPVWNDSMANPVLSYLQQTDFNGKTVAPFWTYITNQGSTEKDFAKQSQNAHVASGLALRSANSISDEKLDQQLNDWLQSIS